MMIDPRIKRALSRFPRRIPDQPPKSLPLLDHFRQAGETKRNALADVEVLFIQHVLGPFLCRLDALFDEGLRPERTWFVDIPYSTNAEALEEILRRYGVPRYQVTAPFSDPIAPYAEVQLRRVQSLLYYLAHGLTGSRLLVIDDGAYFVRALADLERVGRSLTRHFEGRTHIVEQTTRGHRYFANRYPEIHRLVTNALKAPVVSIARAVTKTDFEAPFIGAAAMRALERALQREQVDLGLLNHVAVIGFGPVGEAVFRALPQLGLETPAVVVDPDRGKHPRIRSLGGRPLSSLPERLPKERRYQLVVGCTGYASFDLKDWRLLADDAVLVSTSSAAVEFNRRRFVDLADLYPDDEFKIANREATRKQGIHATLEICDRRRGRDLRFIHASFPVNFDGRMECLPSWVIQATHTLLYAAGHQALDTRRAGLASLDPRVDGKINSDARNYLPQ